MPASLDELLSLAVFARVVEARSFTKAATALGVSKSSVSARVARLEDRLGVRLLERTTRRLAVTDPGLRLYDRAARVLAAADEAAAAGESEALGPRGVLRVSAPVTFAQLHLARAVADFLRANPNVEVALATSDRLVDLVAEGFDVAVRIARLKDSSLVARRLTTDRLVVVGSPAYLAAAGTPRTPADLVAHRCLRYALAAPGTEWGFRGFGSGHRVPVTGPLVASDGTVLREAAAAGLGLAVLPSFMVASDLTAGRLVTVLEGYHGGAEVGVYAVHPHRRHVPPKVRAFVDFLATRFARPPWLATSRGAG